MRVQENGENTSFSLENVWTGTNSGGLTSGEHCNNWTSDDLLDEGSRGITNEEGWTAFLSNDCSAKARLYCFEL